MADGLFAHTLGALRPADDASAEIIKGLGQGELVKVDVTRPRNLGHHRLFWALMSLLHQNLPDDKRAEYPTIKRLVTFFKIATGHVETFLIDGREITVPLSISFAAMDEIAFSQFFNQCCDLIAKDFIHGVKAEDWRKEIASMIGAEIAA